MKDLAKPELEVPLNNKGDGKSNLKESKPEKLLTLFLGLTTSVLAIVVILLVHQNNKLNSEIKKLESASTVIQNDKGKETSQETTSWTKYISPRGEYTLSYPNGIKVRLEDSRLTLQIIGPTQASETELYDGLGLMFQTVSRDNSQSLSDFVDEQVVISNQNSNILEPKKPITINGYAGYSYKARGLGEHEIMYLSSNDEQKTVLIINSTNDPSNNGYHEVAKKIISTFEFVSRQ